MSDTRKPGEYVGADGVLYRYQQGEHGLYRESVDPRSYPAQLPPKDARAAGEALIALADELETEVVEFSGHHRICQRDGVMWLEVRPPSGDWQVEPNDWPILDAYRAGLAKGTP